MNFPKVPKPNVLEYKGVIPRAASEEGIVAILRDIVSYATGAGTSFVSYLDNNPSSTDNWSEYSTSWSEYRVLGIRFEYVPTYAVNTAAITSGPLAHSVLHMKATPAIASYSQALSYGDSKLGHTAKKYVDEWRMASAEEGTFLDCSSPSGTAFVQTAYADTLTTGTTYGTVFRTWLIQFRNPRK
jgi:hypothetical protein